MLKTPLRQERRKSLGKGKSFPVTGPVCPRGWVEVQLYSSMTVVLEGGEWSAARSGRTLTPGNNRYPLYRRLGWPQGGKSRPHRDSIQDRPARSQSLYRLSYPTHEEVWVLSKIRKTVRKLYFRKKFYVFD